MSRRGVQGPNSALTEFLREKGINANEIRARFIARTAAAAAEAEAEAGGGQALSTGAAAPTTEGDNPSGNTGATRATRATRAARAANLVETRIAEVVAGELAGEISDARKQGRAKGKGKGKGKANKKRKRDDDDDDDDDDPDFSAFQYATKLPDVGQQAFCAECDSRFKVTAYSKASEDGDGLLCAPCGRKTAKLDKELVKKAGAAKRTKRMQARKALDADNTGPKSLKDLCIKYVADNIRDVEELGDLESSIMQRICEILARNRSLDNSTLKLFTVPHNERLTLHDCARIDTNELKSIAAFMPQLRHLGLYHAGCATDDVLSYYAEKLTNLESFHIHGAFLVKQQAYEHFFSVAGSRLKSLTLANSRNTESLIESIVTHCPNLTSLNLSQLTRLDDACISHLTRLPHLKSLDISNSGGDITDSFVADLLETLGSGLVDLNLSGLPFVTDVTTSAIHACCAQLRTLDLSDCILLTDNDIYNLFHNWPKNRGLVSLKLKHISMLGDRGLVAAAKHSGRSLEELDINSCADVTKEGLLEALEECRVLEKLDAGFVRAVDDDVVVEAQKRGMRVMAVWGCAKVTACCPLETGVTVVGREADILV